MTETMKIPFESGIEVEISQSMIDDVIREFESENPGRRVHEMQPEEFSRRMMQKIKVTSSEPQP